MRLTRLGKRIYENSIQEVISPWGDVHYWIGGGQPYHEHGQDMDFQTIKEGYVSVTPVHLDLTNYDALKYLKEKWQI